MRKLMMAVAVALILPTMFSCNREDDGHRFFTGFVYIKRLD